MGLLTQLPKKLQKLKKDKSFRIRKQLQSPQGPIVFVDGEQKIAFCSNDYLALANHPKIIAAFVDAAKKYGVGSGASHLVCGHHQEHQMLEEALARFVGRDRALLFSNGYMANMGAINALTDADTHIFCDQLNHASLMDGAFISRGFHRRFHHNDMAHLNELLSASTAKNKLIAVDSVFSMDGDIAPIKKLTELAKIHKATLMVDDAHGFGCLGQSGKGVVEHFDCDQNELPVLMATLGKACGSAGAFIAGEQNLVETLIQFSRTYIYTTALPPANAAASRMALEVIQQEPWRRDNLNKIIHYFSMTAEKLKLPIMPSVTAIQPMLLGDNNRVMAVAQRLYEKGFWLGAIRPPTVPEGEGRLRISLNAEHSEQQVDDLLFELKNCLDEKI